MSIISVHILKRHKVPLNISRVGYNVKDVQQNHVPHQGQADFDVLGNGVKTAIRVVVSDNIGDNMLISYQDLLKFQVIPINFPYKVLIYTVTADVMESIKHGYSDVLNDRLNPVPMKTDKHMLINLKHSVSNELRARIDLRNEVLLLCLVCFGLEGDAYSLGFVYKQFHVVVKTVMAWVHGWMASQP